MGALRASLAAEYPGLPTLRQILTGRTDVNALDLADYVAYMPPGTALGRLVGGPGAWTNEMHMMAAVLHGVDLLIYQNTGIMIRQPKGKVPKPIDPPVPSGQVKAVESRMEQKREKRAARSVARRKIRTNDE